MSIKHANASSESYIDNGKTYSLPNDERCFIMKSFKTYSLKLNVARNPISYVPTPDNLFQF